MKGRRRSESISSSTSSSFSGSSNGRSLSLHQAKSLDSLDRDEMSSDTSRSALPAVPSWKQRREYQRLGSSQHQTTSTLSSCESGESSSCWSRSDGTTTQSSRSSSSVYTGDSSDTTSSSQSTTASVRQRPFQYHQLNGHPKQRPATGSDCNMLAIFSCCLDNRRQREVSRSTSRWTETPEYGHSHSLTPSCSSDCKSWNGSSDDHHSSVHEMGHRFSSHGPASDGPLMITKVPNQRYIHYIPFNLPLCVVCVRVCFRHLVSVFGNIFGESTTIRELMCLTYHFKIDSLSLSLSRPLPLPTHPI
jgi:hypothetical protein